MRKTIASLCLCWFAYCGPPSSNTTPLAFGMTPPQAADALGVPLDRLSARGGSKRYVTVGLAPLPGFYPVGTVLALQFRRGRLTGWKQDWQAHRPQPYF
jgi:hypothetical protein